MRCLGTPTPAIVDIEDPTPREPEPEPEPDYVKALREELSELRDRVQSLEEENRHYHHGANSDDD